MANNHFRFPLIRSGLYRRILLLLRIVLYQLPDRNIILHFGWPLSSCLDRLAVGVMVYNLMTLPGKFPEFNFEISYLGRRDASKDK